MSLYTYKIHNILLKAAYMVGILQADKLSFKLAVLGQLELAPCTFAPYKKMGFSTLSFFALFLPLSSENQPGSVLQKCPCF